MLLWLGEGRIKGIPVKGGWVMRDDYVYLVWGWSAGELCSLRRGCCKRHKVPENLTVWRQQWGWLHLLMIKAQPWGGTLETVLIRLFWLRRLLQATLKTEEFLQEWVKLSDRKHPLGPFGLSSWSFDQPPCHWKLAHTLPPLLGGSHLRASTPSCHLQRCPDPSPRPGSFLGIFGGSVHKADHPVV